MGDSAVLGLSLGSSDEVASDEWPLLMPTTGVVSGISETSPEGFLLSAGFVLSYHLS
jgi:hypothetical protein